jgi:probable F420-dependent oxidoreductase
VSTRRRFRFGVGVTQAPSASMLRQDAQRIEGLGYSTALLPDHLAEYTPLAPLPAATAIAAATDHLRVGTLVLANDFRHPVQLARDVATLDLVSDGRFELGIGSGSLRSDFEATGLPFERASVRLERLRESVTVLKRLLEGDTVTFEGEHYRVHDLEGRPKTVQRPRPPLLIGGGGRRMLEFAAQEADIVGIVPRLEERAVDRAGESVRAMWGSTPAATEEQIGWVRAAAGHRLDGLEIQAFAMVVVVTPQRRAVAEQLAPNLGLGPDDVLQSTMVLVGSVDEIADDLVERRERWGISYVVVPQASYEAFAPVVGRLAGT